MGGAPRGLEGRDRDPALLAGWSGNETGRSRSSCSERDPDPTPHPLTRALWVGLGLLSLLLAVLGAILPILPAFPFWIIAGACFARGSERLHRWLLRQPGVGPIVRRWDQERTVPVSVKWGLIATVAIGTAASILWVPNVPIGYLLLFLFASGMVIGCAFLRTSRPAGRSEAEGAGGDRGDLEDGLGEEAECDDG